jgi:hypothetical protein
MKQKTIASESASRVCYETMEAHARGQIQQWLQDLLEAEVSEFLGRAKSQRRADLEQPCRVASRNFVTGCLTKDVTRHCTHESLNGFSPPHSHSPL